MARVAITQLYEHGGSLTKKPGGSPLPFAFYRGVFIMQYSAACNACKTFPQGAWQHAMTRRRFRVQEYPVYRTTPKAKLDRGRELDG